MADRTGTTTTRSAALLSAVGLAVVLGSLGYASARNDDGAKTFFLSAGLRETVEALAPTLTISPRARPVRTAARRVRPRPLAARPGRSPAPVAVALLPRFETAALLAVEPTWGAATPDAIYKDRTLRPGDAVMTAAGLRIFRGSVSFPYRTDDFVTVASAAALTRVDGKLVAALDGKTKG